MCNFVFHIIVAVHSFVFHIIVAVHTFVVTLLRSYALLWPHYYDHLHLYIVNARLMDILLSSYKFSYGVLSASYFQSFLIIQFPIVKRGFPPGTHDLHTT